jgi:hypothetical protein
MGVGGQIHATAALPPGNRPDTNCTGGWVGPRGWFGRMWKVFPPTGFDSRTFLPVASPYTDWAIRAHTQTYRKLKFVMGLFRAVFRPDRTLYSGPLLWDLGVTSTIIVGGPPDRFFRPLAVMGNRYSKLTDEKTYEDRRNRVPFQIDHVILRYLHQQLKTFRNIGSST